MKRNKEEAVRDLIFKFDDVCRSNNIGYVLVGNGLKEVLETKKIPGTGIAILMTLGDVKRVSKIMNEDKSKGIFIEYYRNNNQATAFDIKIRDRNTTYLTLEDYETSSNYGLFINIFEVEKANNFKKTKRYRNVFGLGKRRFEKIFSNPINTARLLKWKIQRVIKGKEEFDNKLFGAKERLSEIASWNEIFEENTILLKGRTYDTEELKKIDYLDIDSHMIPIAQSEKLASIQTYRSKWLIDNVYEIFDDTTYEEFINNNDIAAFLKAVKHKNKYAAIRRKNNPHIAKTSQAYSTFLMATEIVEMTEAMEDAGGVISEELLREYIMTKEKYELQEMPFVEIPEYEERIEKATTNFKEEDV